MNTTLIIQPNAYTSLEDLRAAVNTFFGVNVSNSDINPAFLDNKYILAKSVNENGMDCFCGRIYTNGHVYSFNHSFYNNANQHVAGQYFLTTPITKTTGQTHYVIPLVHPILGKFENVFIAPFSSYDIEPYSVTINGVSYMLIGDTLIQGV